MCDYDLIVSWTPRLREASWFMTGRDGPEGSRRYADRHLFLRVEQDLNGTGEWTVELRDCHRAGSWIKRTFSSEQDARTATACIYALTRHLGPLEDRFSGQTEEGRWKIRSYDLGPGDERQLARFERASAATVSTPPTTM
jgi:hypothetical protein